MQTSSVERHVVAAAAEAVSAPSRKRFELPASRAMAIVSSGVTAGIALYFVAGLVGIFTGRLRPAFSHSSAAAQTAAFAAVNFFFAPGAGAAPAQPG